MGERIWSTTEINTDVLGVDISKDLVQMIAKANKLGLSGFAVEKIKVSKEGAVYKIDFVGRERFDPLGGEQDAAAREGE